MKTKIAWKKATRRSAMIALSICCIALVSGCDDDNNDSDSANGVNVSNQYALNIDVYLNGELKAEALAQGESIFIPYSGDFTIHIESLLYEWDASGSVMNTIIYIAISSEAELIWW